MVNGGSLWGGGSNQRYALRNQSLEYWTRNSYIQTDRQTYVRRYAHRRLTHRHVAMQKHDPEIMPLRRPHPSRHYPWMRASAEQVNPEPGDKQAMFTYNIQCNCKACFFSWLVSIQQEQAPRQRLVGPNVLSHLRL